jgi:hypothetical protein
MSFVSIGAMRSRTIPAGSFWVVGNGKPRIWQRSGDSEKTHKKSSQQKLRPHRIVPIGFVRELVRELGTQLLSAALDLAGNGAPRIRQWGVGFRKDR